MRLPRVNSGVHRLPAVAGSHKKHGPTAPPAVGNTEGITTLFSVGITTPYFSVDIATSFSVRYRNERPEFGHDWLMCSKFAVHGTPSSRRRRPLRLPAVAGSYKNKLPRAPAAYRRQYRRHHCPLLVGITSPFSVGITTPFLVGMTTPFSAGITTCF